MQVAELSTNAQCIFQFTPSVKKNASYYLESGHWFLSIYNDDGESKRVGFVAKVSKELTRNCPKGCSGKGECVLGRCQCQPGFDGPDCGQSKSPLMVFLLVPILCLSQKVHHP